MTLSRAKFDGGYSESGNLYMRGVMGDDFDLQCTRKTFLDFILLAHICSQSTACCLKLFPQTASFFENNTQRWLSPIRGKNQQKCHPTVYNCPILRTFMTANHMTGRPVSVPGPADNFCPPPPKKNYSGALFWNFGVILGEIFTSCLKCSPGFCG